MPRDVTPQDIADAYLWGWELGLKALAIYRDGSKQSQPLATAMEGDRQEKGAIAKPRRERLPDTRKSLTHKFNVAGHEGYITVGLYEDGRPGEMFITMAKEGSTVGGLMDCFGTAISIALQYGVPLPVLVHKFSHARFEPMGHTTNPEIRIAKSVIDYIFRWMGLEFISGYRESMQVAEPTSIESFGNNGTAIQTNGMANSSGTKQRTPNAREPVDPDPGDAPTWDRLMHDFARYQIDAPACDNCGAITVRNGNCYLCHNCGNSMGCS
jgi:ribonucleoside-diphosphate reductase alpha chain